MENNTNAPKPRPSRKGSLNPMWGKSQSQETRDKISAKQTARYDALRKMVKRQQAQQQIDEVLHSKALTDFIHKKIVEEINKLM